MAFYEYLIGLKRREHEHRERTDAEESADSSLEMEMHEA